MKLLSSIMAISLLATMSLIPVYGAIDTQYIPRGDEGYGLSGQACVDNPRLKYYYPTPSCYGKIPVLDHDKVIMCYGCNEWDIMKFRSLGVYAFIPNDFWIPNLVWL